MGLGSIYNQIISKISGVGKKRKSTSYTTADATLRARKAKSGKSYTTADATLASRRVKRSKYAKPKRRGRGPVRGPKNTKRNPSRVRKGRRRSTKPGIRKGITGRTYSGTPMDRAAVTAAIAAAMEKRKNK